MQKKRLRTELCATRDALTQSDTHVAAEALLQCLIPALNEESPNGRLLAGYVATRNEINVDAVMIWWLNQGGRLVLPRVANGASSSSPEYELAEVGSLSNDLAPGRYGILEPLPHCLPCETNDIGIWLVPGVGFDQNNYRLGYGKGIYDRLLSQSSGKRVGVGYKCQLVNTVFPEAHDARMDAIYCA